jgi:hypothetical protein
MLQTASARRVRAQAHKALLPAPIPRSKRLVIEDAIEAHLGQATALIALLDAHDKDPDLEASVAHGMPPAALRMVDLEADDPLDHGDFGWPESHGAGSVYSPCPHEDDEPSLAHDNSFDQLSAFESLELANLSEDAWCADGDMESDLEQEGGDEDRDPMTDRHFAAVQQKIPQSAGLK